MKKVLILLATLIVISCNSKKSTTKEDPEVGISRIAAIYILSDSSRFLEVLTREIKFVPKRDSVTKKNTLVYDTVWYLERRLPLLDANKKPVLDSLGRPRMDSLRYFPLIKDSTRVIWKIENKNIDSLLKKGYPISND